MAEEARRLTELLEEADRAGSLWSVHDALVRFLAERFQIIVSDVMVFTPEGNIEFVSHWGGPSPLEPGAVVNPDVTPHSGENARQLAMGRSILVRMAEQDLGLIGDVVTGLGLRSIVVVPFRDEEEAPIGMISFGSPDDDGFAERDVPLVTALVRALEYRVIALLPPLTHAE